MGEFLEVHCQMNRFVLHISDDWCCVVSPNGLEIESFVGFTALFTGLLLSHVGH